MAHKILQVHVIKYKYMSLYALLCFRAWKMQTFMYNLTIFWTLSLHLMSVQIRNGNNFESSNLQFYLGFPKYFRPKEYGIHLLFAVLGWFVSISVGRTSSQTDVGVGVGGGGGVGIGWHLCLGGGFFGVSFSGALCCAISVGTALWISLFFCAVFIN